MGTGYSVRNEVELNGNLILKDNLLCLQFNSAMIHIGWINYDEAIMESVEKNAYVPQIEFYVIHGSFLLGILLVTGMNMSIRFHQYFLLETLRSPINLKRFVTMNFLLEFVLIMNLIQWILRWFVCIVNESVECKSLILFKTPLKSENVHQIKEFLWLSSLIRLSHVTLQSDFAPVKTRGEWVAERRDPTLCV